MEFKNDAEKTAVIQMLATRIHNALVSLPENATIKEDYIAYAQRIIDIAKTLGP